jgi:hypothetical protein
MSACAAHSATSFDVALYVATLLCVPGASARDAGETTRPMLYNERPVPGVTLIIYEVRLRERDHRTPHPS